MSIRIVEVKDEYINYLKKFFYSTMLDNKMNNRRHQRKYIGVLIKINDFNYFAPLSSPKKSDYNGDGSIKKTSTIVFRMIDNTKHGEKLLGTIKLNNMIPVPYMDIVEYDINKELDLNYKALICNEIRCIQKNTTRIQKSANFVYHIKKNELANIKDSNRKFYKSIMPFEEVEEKCSEYERNEKYKEDK